MKSLRSIGITVGLCALSIFVIDSGWRFYVMNSEIQKFSYAALRDNIQRYPEDRMLINQITTAISDGEIIGSEHKEIVDRLLDKNGIYHGSKIGEDHSQAKAELVKALDSMARS
ncbi:MAG: hypothetical protein N0E56_15790 [Candidatus Thiodiazotropha endolucinida]|nr:hypothetical protein [Candidatus Thiodiazotropha taylori]MCW4268085.1 hypothetical protein [Candidatus Thiodiazotropha endolucinida]